MVSTVSRPAPDERVAARSPLRKLLGRPEMAALLGAVVVFVFFSIVAPPFLNADALSNVLYSSASMGIMAVSVSLLMIGGEFDLSAGVMVTTSALFASMFSYQLTLNVWAGVVVSLIFTLGIGFLNGFIFVKTRLPSFIVTLGMFLMLQGLNLGFTKLITGNVATPTIENMAGFKQAQDVFAANWTIDGVQVSITILWWILFVAVATWILLRTRAGNWIFSVGGSAPSARAVGVPVTRTKIALFMGVSLTAWFYGMHLLFNYKVVQSGEGVGNELYYIICAVVGGCLLTGGYGSAIGAAIGALIWGMTSNGIIYAQWDPNWFKFFLGALLLAATVINLIVRRRVEAGK
jgi:simple sugar transport system permease protein